MVQPGSVAGLAARTTDGRKELGRKADGLDELGELVKELSSLHYRLFVEGTRSLLLILQGLDASGKDGTTKSVFTGVNPQGCRVVSFKEPTAGELEHDYLWRVHLACPVRGEMAIFNRSQYEDVVTARVRKLAPARVWKRRPRHIREFERLLVDEGTTIVKVYLHVSREKQVERLRERLTDPEKSWKFRESDVNDLARRDEFVSAYEDVINETSTKWAPWYVVPADHNWARNLLVARILVSMLRRMDPQLPEPPAGLDEIVIE